ncbi:MAG: rod shape-determining protein MreC [Candidatus Saccharibacteria bacterium]
MFSFLRSKSFWGIIIIGVITLVVIKQTSVERTKITLFEEVIRGTFTPLQKGVNELRHGFGSVGDFFAARNKLVRENERLKGQIKDYQLKNQTLKEYKYQAQRLKSLLAFKDKNVDTMELVGAEIIARSPDTWYKTVTLNKGSADGITVNMPVITPQGLVGRVNAVTSGTATVLLITDREGAVGAIVQENRTQGIVEGLGNSGSLTMSDIPFYSKVKYGNTVVTSNLSEVYPPGIIIGKIKSIIDDKNVTDTNESKGLLIKATVVPAVDFDKLEEVFVVKRFLKPLVQPEPPPQEQPQPAQPAGPS